MLTTQGLSWDEARRISYPEMWVLTRQALYQQQRKTMLDMIFAIQTMPMASKEDKDEAVRNIQQQVQNLEYKFYGDINVTN